MRSILTLTLSLFFLTFLNAQPPVPLNESTGEVEYIDVVEVSGADAHELFKRLDHWYQEFFVNPSSVIQERDAESYFINGRHNLSVHVESDGVQRRYGQVRYNINVAARDGRYRVVMDDIIIVQRPRLPIHEWLDPDDPMRERNFALLSETHEHFTALLENLKETMSNPVPGDEEDEW